MGRGGRPWAWEQGEKVVGGRREAVGGDKCTGNRSNTVQQNDQIEYEHGSEGR